MTEDLHPTSVSSVVRILEEICALMPPDSHPVEDYFEDNYIGLPNLGGHRRPTTFPISLFNTHSKAENELPRTNNSVEGLHRRAFRPV